MSVTEKCNTLGYAQHPRNVYNAYVNQVQMAKKLALDKIPVVTENARTGSLDILGNKMAY